MLHASHALAASAHTGDLESTLVAIAAASFVVLLTIALMLGTALTRLRRIEARLADPPKDITSQVHAAQPAGKAPLSSSATQGGDYERFLAEDAKRLLLGKKEQAAAYRAWRKENGLTWNAGDEKS